jgi:DNA-binding transcriptional ArsR family regulator
VQFVFSVPLDLMNAMYFTSLVPDMAGAEGWPVRVREQMAPDLLAELDFLYNYPAGDPAIVGTLQDFLFAHPAVWDDVASLVEFVRNTPVGLGEPKVHPGIQGLIYEATFRYLDQADTMPYKNMPPREAVEARMRALDDRDADAIMAHFDRPEELRERIARLIERFYEEHYREELPRRRPALERSITAHTGATREEAFAVIRKLTGRPSLCVEDEDICPGPYSALIFCPSVDVGPYLSCADIGGPQPVHGLFYPCEAAFTGNSSPDAEETTRMARVYKALGDEQRLRILHLLQHREMYAQEIVDRMDVHQSVISRHLSFLRAVGLVQVRKHNNMKFFSLNPAITGELGKTLDLFAGAVLREA